MVRGLGTDSKLYKHLTRNDDKWLFEDLRVLKRTVEQDIEEIRPDEESLPAAATADTKLLTVERIFPIIFPGIIGSLCLMTGLYAFIFQHQIVGLPIVLFGLICVIAFCLSEWF